MFANEGKLKERELTQLVDAPGAKGSHDGREYVILRVADINMVLAKAIGSEEKFLLKIGGLGPAVSVKKADALPSPEQELLSVTEHE